MAQPITIPHSMLCKPSPAQGEQILCVTIEEDQVTNNENRPIPQCILLNYLKKKNPTLMLMKVQFHEKSDPQHIKSALERGVNMLSLGHFSFLGCSEEQLRNRECYLMHGTDSEAYDLLSEFLQFNDIGDLDERAGKIAVLFTECENAIDGDLDQEDPDKHIETKQGMMSPDVARRIQQALNIENYTPSVVQISFQGYEGILVTSKTLEASQVCFPASMQKLKILESVRDACTSLGIVDYSRPHSNGYLDEMMILYLQKRGIPGDYLKSLEHDFTNLLQGLPDDWNKAECCLKIRGKVNELQKLYEAAQLDVNDVPIDVKEVLLQIKKEMEDAYFTSSRELQVLVPKSREVFGVRDPQNLLDKDECFLNPTLWSDDQKAFQEEVHVTVIRRPCYFETDIRVLKVNRSTLLDKYSHLKDCIIFSSKSSFPSAEEDIRGEKYFVSWDEKLIPKTPNQSVQETISDCMTKYALSIHAGMRPSCLDSILYCFTVQGIFSPCFHCGWSCSTHSIHKTDGNFKREQMRELHNYFASFQKSNCPECLMKRAAEKFKEHFRSHDKTCKQCLSLEKFLTRKLDPVSNRKALQSELKKLEGNPGGNVDGIVEGAGLSADQSDTGDGLQRSRSSASRDGYKPLGQSDQSATFESCIDTVETMKAMRKKHCRTCH